MKEPMLSGMAAVVKKTWWETWLVAGDWWLVIGGRWLAGGWRKRPTFVFGDAFFQFGGEGAWLVMGGRWLAGGESTC